MAVLKFNANEHEPSRDNSPVPPGEYVVAVTDSAIKPTKAGNGKRLAIEYTIIEGKNKNRKIFEGLNIVNPNPKAEEIAFGQLSALCRACGKLQISDSAELHGIPFLLKVGVRAANGDYEAQNQVKGYKELSGKAAATEEEDTSVDLSEGEEETEAGWDR